MDNTAIADADQGNGLGSVIGVMHSHHESLAPVVQFAPQAPSIVRTEDLPDNVPPLLAMQWARYPGKSAKNFLKTARASGLRVWGPNERVLRIDREELLRWRKHLTV